MAGGVVANGLREATFSQYFTGPLRPSSDGDTDDTVAGVAYKDVSDDAEKDNEAAAVAEGRFKV